MCQKANGRPRHRRPTGKTRRPAGLRHLHLCPEEDETVIARFLAEHADFELVEPTRFAGFDRGRPSWVSGNLPANGLEKTIRLWPHRFPGEGHFIALMQRIETKKT